MIQFFLSGKNLRWISSDIYTLTVEIAVFVTQQTLILRQNVAAIDVAATSRTFILQPQLQMQTVI